MEYSLKELLKSEVELSVSIPFNEFESQVKKAAVLISEEIEIEGFRKGKSPYGVVKQKVGELAIYEKAADLAIRESHRKLTEQLFHEGKFSKEFPPVGRPEITVTKLAPGNDLCYKIKFAVLPQVKLPDYISIAGRLCKERKKISVSDGDVTKAIDWMRESRAPLVTVERPARLGDRVELDFEVRHGGVKIEGGESRNHPLVLGKGKFLPGFEEALMGMHRGEEKNFIIKVPENWHEKNIVGKSLDVKVAVKLVQELQLSDLTDDFAKNVGSFPTMDALRTSVREGIAQEKKEKEKERMRVLIIEEIAKEAVMEVPDVLRESELDRMFEEFKSGIGGTGIKWEDYLLHIHPVRSQTPEASADASVAHRTSNGVKKAEEMLRVGWKDEAGKRVRIALCLREIARVNNIESGEEEIKARADQFLAQFKSADRAEGAIDAERLREYTKGVLRDEKVFEFLEKI